MANPRRDVPYPASQVSGLTGYATLTGAGLILGRIAAIVFIFALASAGTTWIMGSDRTEAVAADGGGGPASWAGSRPGSALRSR